jgi:hypothetical protein
MRTNLFRRQKLFADSNNILRGGSSFQNSPKFFSWGYKKVFFIEKDHKRAEKMHLYAELHVMCNLRVKHSTRAFRCEF